MTDERSKLYRFKVAAFIVVGVVLNTSIIYVNAPFMFDWLLWPKTGYYSLTEWHDRLVARGYVGRDCFADQSHTQLEAHEPFRYCLTRLEIVDKRLELDGTAAVIVERCSSGSHTIERKLIDFYQYPYEKWAWNCSIAMFPTIEDRGIGEHTQYANH